VAFVVRWRPVFLDDVFVPDEQRLGDEGQGFYGPMRTFDIARTTLAASATGLARACFELATSPAWALTRHGHFCSAVAFCRGMAGQIGH
jgi:acyl-CoA dehydrogenase